MTRTFRFCSAGLILAGSLATPAAVAAQTRAAAGVEDLKVGDRAPDFTLPGTDGKTYSLSQLKGRTLVLAWFPKAFTGG
jgi:thioredoxin-dependent peroxiredoxin